MDNYQYTYDDTKVSIVFDETENKEKPLAYTIDLIDPTRETIPYTIDIEDLVEFGFPRELINRFNTFLHTRNYSIEDLKKILINSTGSPMIGLKQWIEHFKKELVFDDIIYEIIATKAYELNQGARGLETVNNIRNLLLEEVLMGKDKTIYLTPELVDEAEKHRTNRNGRK